MLKSGALILVFSVLFAAPASIAAASRIEQPIALDALPSTGLIVLGAKGTVYELQGSKGQYRIARNFHIPVNQYPSDLTLAQINQEFYIFVTSNLTSLLGQGGRVTQYTLDGRTVAYWDIRGVCAGIDFDGRTHTVYFVQSNGNEIIAIKITPNGKPVISSLGKIPQITQIGPLAYDPADGRVYVADVGEGTIYAFNPATRRSEILVKRLGNPAALRVVVGKRQLIATDSQRKSLVILDTSGKAKPKLMAVGSQLKQPSGLAFVDGLLAVGDSLLGHIFFLGENGQVLGQF